MTSGIEQNFFSDYTKTESLSDIVKEKNVYGLHVFVMIIKFTSK
jgi:hypothetical protein